MLRAVSANQKKLCTTVIMEGAEEGGWGGYIHLDL